jgi:hypothetical protein
MTVDNAELRLSNLHRGAAFRKRVQMARDRRCDVFNSETKTRNVVCSKHGSTPTALEHPECCLRA